ncbi:TonB-dependent receptor [Chitinibacter bivalviorum]|uniref:TonB-dependent receptor n=1 Tax=Chitinibacter bivalviorum TaxID=2739434 RepID=A0A7H9BJ38_9NEIS|nr:TonB-dependent receptor [Chitinibacter bivalviorum]QLG88663.1 TonB-dependent receptor [Chitinibacter bivalviorum]
MDSIQDWTLRPLVCAVLAAISSPVYANEVTRLEEVVVTATREETPLNQAPISIGKVNEQQIDQLRPTFIGQVLDQIPGVHMTNLGNEQHNMSIRQPMSYSAVYQYLEDGIPIRPVGIFNHNALYEINLAGNNGIEVVRGPASSLYGSNAVGGAVNFTTAAPSSNPYFSTSIQASDQGYRRVDLAASDSWGDTGLRIAGYYADRGASWQDYNEMDKVSLTARLDHWLSDSALWKTTLTYSKLNTDMPGTLNETDFNTRPGFSYQTFTYRDVEALRASTGIEGQFNRGGFTSATVYYRNNSTNQLPSYLIFNLGPDSAAGRTTENSFTSLGLSAFHRQQWGNFKLLVGGLLEESPNDQGETALLIKRDPKTGKYLSYKTGAVRRDYHVDLSNQALYADASYQFDHGLGLSAGLRYDGVKYDYTNYLKPSLITGAPSQTQTFASSSPKINLTWQASPELFMYGGYSQGFTPPDISTLYSSAVVPDLKSATFDQFEFGTRWQPNQDLNLNAAVYRLNGQDELVNYSIEPGKSFPRNAGKTLHEGVELGANWQATTAWSVRLAGQYARHSYVQYQPSPLENYAGKDIPAAPNWQGTLEIAYQPIQGARIALETAYLGPYWMDSPNTVQYEGYTLFNLRGEYQYKAWTLWAQVLNLANSHYAEIASSSYKGQGLHNGNTQDSYSVGAPRTFVFGMSYAFDGKGAAK